MVTLSEPSAPAAGLDLRTRFPTLVVFASICFALLIYLLAPLLYLRAIRMPFNGRVEPIQDTLMRIPALDQLNYFVIPYLTGLVFLICGVYVFFIRRSDPAGRAFSLFAVCGAVPLAALFDLYTTRLLPAAWIFTLAVAGGALLNLAMQFPERLALAQRFPHLRPIAYGLGGLLGLAGIVALYDRQHLGAVPIVWGLIYAFTSLALGTFLVTVALRRSRSPSTAAREQARLVLRGALLAGMLAVAGLAALSFQELTAFTLLLGLALAFFSLFTSYAILRYRLLSTDTIISNSMVYALLAGLTMGAYALLVAGLSLVVGNYLSSTNPLLIGLLVFLVAIGINPARNFLQNTIDRYFFRGQAVYREVQEAFSQELTRRMDLPAILRLLRSTVDSAISPVYLHIYVYDSQEARFKAVADDKGIRTSQVSFPQAGPLVQLLSGQREALFLADLTNLPHALRVESARVKLLDAVLYVPLPGREQLCGWLALGVRRSGEPFTVRDSNFLESLANQAALAIERAQVVADLERRVREMNVLTRVAQGVSFTVTFDDILELISAQTNQVIPARDFRVTLLDKDTGVLQHMFYLENDERLRDRENQPLEIGAGLEQEVIHGQRAIITDDYERECRRRGVLPNSPGVNAWLGVPLNVGADTIGAMSIGSRDLNVTYTEDQCSLLQAIADQASGAIIKARSLQESERRAHQLAKLNEIGLGLTSTLDLNPLLNEILASAVDILECQAGSLFLIDPQTDELIFEVVTGPVAENLTGRRLAPGTGLAGQAVLSGKAMIANDAKRRKEWFEQTDEQTGFDTQDLLVVPMRFQDRVVGVIEVINKIGGAPFTRADQDLLTAFTSQATIAIENARLYTMTDQALAARVEELSVMQRIDRELNAGLDIERVMRLTLDWAMRQSHADAGLVGSVHQNELRIMVTKGYPVDDLTDGSQAEFFACLMARQTLLQEAICKGAPVHRTIPKVAGADTPQAPALLPNAQQQIVVPIRRETQTIGMLLLETTAADTITVELVDFLTRLSDHAAIAIANARLYEEVNDANLAKSRFVSFVAHELKNPMASIKGYTELVASGMAGAINDMQAGFLATVKSNVDRMNTIVSDLNDLTKIQTGNIRLDFKAVCVKDILDEVTRSLMRQVEEKSQTMVIQLAPDLPVVWADPARLAQILTNLMSNAHKYTPENKSFTITAGKWIDPDDALSSDSLVLISVSDEGIGIAEEDQKQIFQQYFRTDLAKEMASGTGLGLSITRSLIELHGGRVWFKSQAGQGTTFYFTMPIAEAQ